VQIAEFIGLPEAQIPLAQAALYVACAPKSNSSAKAIQKAVSDVNQKTTIKVPKHLKDSHYYGAKKIGYGKGYKYPHSYEGGFVPQQYLPGGHSGQYYQPKEIGREKNIKHYLQKLQTLINNMETDENPEKE